MTIYLAGPLFSEAEQAYCRRVKSLLESQGHEVVWPFELIPEGEVVALGPKAKEAIFEACVAAMDRCDAMVAILDGAQVDDGTAWEMGYWYSKWGKERIFGIRTDFRQAGDTKWSVVNLMIEMGCGRIVKGTEELLSAVRDLR